MKKKIITGKIAKEQLLEGAELLYKAVAATLSPKGQNVVIEAFGEPVVTHDGVTAAKAIENIADISPGARVGIEMIKASSSKTNDNVGDGTTTSTILAYYLIKYGMEKVTAGSNPMVLRRELEAASEQVLKQIPELADPLDTKEKFINIATISSEDPVVGKEVGEMYHKLGRGAMVVVEMGSKTETEYEIVEGFTFDRGVFNQMMITDGRTQSTTVENPAILLANQSVGFRDVANLLQEIYDEGKDSLVIICDDMKQDLIDQALLRLSAGDFTIIGIKSPGFGEQKEELFRDLAALTGAEVFGGKFPKNIDSATFSQMGNCEKIVCTTKDAIITGSKKINKYIENLQGRKDSIESDFEAKKIEKRVANLRGKVGQIRVGGNTEMEAEERKYLIDDATSAVEAAMEDGVVPGGATTYLTLAQNLKPSTPGAEVLFDALHSPFKVLMKNAGMRYSEQLKNLTQYGDGVDVMTGEVVNLKERGIIDPAMVIKQAITNAVSVAGSALTTGVLITNEEEKKHEKEEE